MSRRILFIGLDAVPAQMFFSDFIKHMPNIRNLMEKAQYGTLTSCNPPITVPAWTVMMSSKEPGELGIYGFRHRRGGSYNQPWTVNSSSVKEKRVWEILEYYGKKSIIIGIPPAYPPYQVNGKLISCFLTPPNAKEYTYPNELRQTIEELVGDYKFDVVFRTQDRKRTLEEIYTMTERRFRVIEELGKNTDWDFLVFMEIGTDRLHHAFWKYFDKSHPKYTPNNEYEEVIPEYYRFLDGKIGDLLRSLVDENTTVIIASDHGTKSMKGAVCINEWLIDQGLLVLKRYPEKVTDIEKAEVDWSKSTAWGWGGYYARIFLNVMGREATGYVPMEEYESTLNGLIQKIKDIKDPSGKSMNTLVFKPEELYRRCLGDKPDLMVYFDNLDWRSAGTIGHNTLYLSENDTGPDDSVHSMEGIFIMHDPSTQDRGLVTGLTIYDVAPTILEGLNIPIPTDMRGRPISHKSI